MAGPGKSQRIINENIAKHRKKGKSTEQATAIAKSKAREAKRKREEK